MIVNPAETAELTEMLFGCGLGLAQGTMYYMGSRSPMHRGKFEA